MRSPRVLHVSTSRLDGGAFLAAYRIHLAQRAFGIDSHMLVLDPREQFSYVHAPIGSLARLISSYTTRLSHRIAALQKTPSNPVLHSINFFGSGLGAWINRSGFDLVNLHWLGGEMLSVEEIGRIRIPMCWTMHDMWAFSGAEHYDDIENPSRYRSDYSPQTRPVGYSGPDIDAWVWRRKQRAWKGKDFGLISPSRWLAECAACSSLMARQQCTVISNCVDMDVFKPTERCHAREVLNLRSERKYILFGAMSSTSDVRKGFHLLQAALQELSRTPGLRENTELLVFGAEAPPSPPDMGFPTHYLGRLHDEEQLALLYSAADVFAAPSMQDNLPNTLVESMACGTPCVAFDLGGMPDLIRERVSGALVPPFHIDSFTRALANLLQQPLDRAETVRHARQYFDPAVVAAKYLAVYQSVLEQKSPSRFGLRNH